MVFSKGFAVYLSYCWIYIILGWIVMYKFYVALFSSSSERAVVLKHIDDHTRRNMLQRTTSVLRVIAGCPRCQLIFSNWISEDDDISVSTGRCRKIESRKFSQLYNKQQPNTFINFSHTFPLCMSAQIITSIYFVMIMVIRFRLHYPSQNSMFSFKYFSF